jgi:hypothetical protein
MGERGLTGGPLYFRYQFAYLFGETKNYTAKCPEWYSIAVLRVFLKIRYSFLAADVTNPIVCQFSLESHHFI